MRQDVMFKGIGGNLQLLIPDQLQFAEVLNQIQTKLAASATFFGKGSIIHIPLAEQRLSKEEQEQLTAVFAEYGLFWEAIEITEKETGTEEGPAQPDDETSAAQTLIVEKTLRGGQKVVSEHSVLVIGDVNPGAEIIAGGDIVVLGTCRGIAHAGAYGNREATIKANRLLASQLRIAGVIARAPDQLNNPEYPEIARIIDGAVTIEPAE